MNSKSDRVKKTSNGCGDWTKKKGLSVVRHDAEYDVQFHDIDVRKVEKWYSDNEAIYRDDLDLLNKLKEQLPRECSPYSTNPEHIREQRSKSEPLRLLYDFHEVANERYHCKFGDEVGDIGKRHDMLKAKIKAFLKKPKEKVSKADEWLNRLIEEYRRVG